MHATTILEHVARADAAPAARKAAGWSALLLIVHPVFWGAAVVAGSAAGAVPEDRALFDLIAAAWMVLLGIGALIGFSAAVAPNGKAWSGHALLALHAIPPVAMAYLFNTAAMLAYVPVVVLLGSTAFDHRVAVTGLLCSVAYAVAMVVLESIGAVPAAYLTLRSFTPAAIDFAESAVAILMLQLFIMIATSCSVTLSARRWRQDRLLEALRAAARPAPS